MNQVSQKERQESDRYLVEHAHGRLSPVHAHMRLQVARCCKRPPADLAAERSLARMRAVVHLHVHRGTIILETQKKATYKLADGQRLLLEGEEPESRSCRNVFGFLTCIIFELQPTH